MRLAAEPRLEGRVAREVDPQGLHRDVATQPQIAPAQHLCHAAVAQHLAKLVAVAEPSWLSHDEDPLASQDAF